MEMAADRGGTPNGFQGLEQFLHVGRHA
jgi:hypothetical protein